MLDALELYREAQKGALLLAPNIRSARQLRSRILALASGPAEAAELSERVLPWRAWTTHLWQHVLLEGRDTRVLLQPLQERLLWEQILESAPEAEGTIALLDLCQSAATLLFQYNVTDFGRAAAGVGGSGDPARFAEWFRMFLRQCDDQQLLAFSGLEGALAGHASVLGTPGTLIRCGLADLSPAQEALLGAFTRRGTTVVEATTVCSSDRSPVLLECEDETAELRSLVQHIEHFLQATERPSIAVIVPDLSAARERIERAVREYLDQRPTGALFTEDLQPLWEFSTGRSLAAFGVIADALHVLAWSVRELEAEELSLLLRSPHLSWPTDAESAASLDAALLRRHPHLSGTWSPRSAARLLERSGPKLSEALAERTRSWAGLRHSAASFSSFAERSRQLLRTFGWLGSGERSSTEFQAVKRFESLLDDLAALDITAVAPPSWPEFVHRLIAAARSTNFAPQNTGAPVQFLTPDESTGVDADEAWILHADESRWSAHMSAHPLLPRRLQQQYGMPGMDPAADQLRRSQQIERIAQIAPVVTFSYSNSGESGEQRPSPMVAGLPLLRRKQPESSGNIAQLQASSDLQPFADGAPVPIAFDASRSASSGGVSTLQSQAACAFRAFAERRLGSAALETHDLGMHARDRGSLLHNALHIFWQDTQNSDALHRLIANNKLDVEIRRCVDLALRAHRQSGDRWSESYLEIQRTRLETLLDRWLHMEATRPRFQIAALEREVLVTINELPLRTRVDRVDRVFLADGSEGYVVLDYKAGRHDAKKWKGSRPDEPQLPLYATTALSQLVDLEEAPAAAIAFALVRPGDELEFVSAPQKTVWLSKDPKANGATLESELDGWRSTLERLAQDFRRGEALVEPKDYPATCRYCDQRLLCRLNPALIDPDDAVEVEA